MRIVKALLVFMIVGVAAVNAQGPPPAAKVVVAKVILQNVSQNLMFLGTLFYERVSHISSEVSGLVTRVNVRSSDNVEKGTPLVVLDTELLENEIKVYENQVEQAKLSISHSKKNLLRMESLYKTGGAREKDYDEAEFVYQNNLLKMKSSRTALEKLLIKKRKSIIYAPFDGVILEKNVDSGDWVQQGKTLVSIGSSNDLFIKVPIAEYLLKYIVKGRKIPVVINAFKKELTGVIDSVSPSADPKTKNVFLTVRIPVLERAAQNMSVSVYLPTGESQNLAIIPRDALVKSQGQDYVYTVKDGKAVQLPVRISAYLGSNIGTDSNGITEGMQVVVDGNERLRPSQQVAVVREL